MYLITIKSAKAELRTQFELDGILKRLPSEQYRPTLRSGAREMLATAGRPVQYYSEVCASFIQRMFANGVRTPVGREVIGEIFFREGIAIALQPSGGRLLVVEAREHGKDSQMDEFCDLVKRAAVASIDGRRLRGMSFDWSDANLPARRRMVGQPRPLIRKLSDLSTKPVVIPEGVDDDAELLVRRERRDFLIRLAQLGKARSVDAQADVEAADVVPLLQRGLVRKEFLILCRQDSRTLCTIQSREEIEGESGQRFRCSCGRSFAEELVQEIYALTDRSRKLLDGSHWMTVWITSQLAGEGISIDRMSWGATAGEDEIDIVAHIQDQVVFFELKDRAFGLGDAYPFTARVQRYGANAGVIISMEGIAEEASKFLQEQARSLQSTIYTVAGEREVRAKVPEIVSRTAESAFIEAFQNLFQWSNVDVSPILRAWANKSARRVAGRP
jgi:hypothetical protein